MTSEAYADLGGTSISLPPSLPGHRHHWDIVSGWCGCGMRLDGRIAEYSPAAAAAKGVAIHDPLAGANDPPGDADATAGQVSSSGHLVIEGHA